VVKGQERAFSALNILPEDGKSVEGWSTPFFPLVGMNGRQQALPLFSLCWLKPPGLPTVKKEKLRFRGQAGEGDT
jgi:hypothetical protein